MALRFLGFLLNGRVDCLNESLIDKGSVRCGRVLMNEATSHSHKIQLFRG